MIKAIKPQNKSAKPLPFALPPLFSKSVTMLRSLFPHSFFQSVFTEKRGLSRNDKKEYTDAKKTVLPSFYIHFYQFLVSA